MHKAGGALVAVAGLLVLLGPGLAQALQLGEERPGSLLSGGTLKVSETFYYKYNLFLDDDREDEDPPPYAFHEFVNRTAVDLRFKRFNLGAQFDLVAVAPNCAMAGFAESYEERYGDGADCISPNSVLGSGWDGALADESVLFRMEKLYLRYKSRSVDFELGDFYAAFGRGLTLSFVKRPEVDSDNSLLGGRLDIRTRPVDFTLLAGMTNPQEVSMELRNRSIAKTDWALISGATLLARLNKQVRLGVHGVGYNLESAPSWAVGGTLAADGLGGAVDLFMEADGFFYGYEDRQLSIEAGDPERGYAVYGTLTAYAGPMTLLIEGKHYKDSQRLVRPGPVVPLQYTQPPSLEHEGSITEDINGSVQSNDITGWRAQAEFWWMKTDTTFTLGFANAYDREPHPPFSSAREITVHPTLAIEQPI
ncbi:MAG: DUF6029 family protein, partial [Myxococcota bacterium]|nr:DUF6029 family protein [Myxococcota bacterium]